MSIMTEANTPKSVFETILGWSVSKPDWQRDALRRIVSQGTPTDVDISELVALCKKGQGDQSITVKPSILKTEHLPVDPEAGESIALIAISDVKGVNQLAPNTTLKFQPNSMNIVYGQNGTGKSGYARILKRACRARHSGEIMPDAFNPAAAANPTANITIATKTGEEQTITWQNEEQPHPVLSAITVFDRDSGAVHLRQKNEVWFRPFGLDIPDDLAAVCQQVKESLSAEKNQTELEQDQLFNDPIWSNVSRIGRFLSQLTADSRLEQIDSEQNLDEKDQTRLLLLNRDLGLEPQKVANDYHQQATKIEQLLVTLKSMQTLYSDETFDDLLQKKADAQKSRQAADLAAERSFGELELDGVGSAIWLELWETARRYSENLQHKEQDFPPKSGDLCALCHQTIDEIAAVRMQGFDEFIQADTERRAKNTTRAFNTALETFTKKRVDIRLLGEARNILKKHDEELAHNILEFLARARVRRWQFLKNIQSHEKSNLISLGSLPAEFIESLISELKSYAAEIIDSSNPTHRQQLEEERDNLKDRQQKKRLKQLAVVEIMRLKRIRRLEACIGETATNTVTKLGNTIADELITPIMRDRFASEIGRLAAGRIRVDVVRSGGRFGSPQYEVKFFANPKAKVSMVLSEGEQTCVALASYLTELANASHKSTLVFDDPVSSLDHRWRRKVAERLVEESKERQVIVFTHDLVFVNDLHEMATKAKTLGTLGHLSRSSQGVGVFSEGLPWRAARVRERVDKLEKAAREAKELFESYEEEAYHSEVVRIYGELRAAWERGLEDVVFAGVLMRHRDYINTKNLKKIIALEESDVEAFSEGFQKCCDLTNAHDPSRGRDGNVPPPDELLADIQALASWERALREKQNAIT